MKIIKNSEYCVNAMVGTIFLAGMGMCTIAWQVINWVSTGIWNPLPFSRFFIGMESSWVYNPNSWYGFAKVVQCFFSLPLWVGFILTGIIACCIGYIFDRVIDYQKEVKNRTCT